jgi:hypothetical protein
MKRQRKTKATIQTVRLNRRAQDELLHALCYLARMGDALEDQKQYARLSGGLSPLDAFIDHEGKPPGLLDAAHRRSVLFMRDCLRAVWKREDVNGITLRNLLGLNPQFSPEGLRRNPLPTEDYMAIWRRFEVSGPEPEPLPSIYPNLRTGEIHYRPATRFQEALDALLKNGWRARVCEDCGNYYVADKPAQRFCSTGCGKDRKKRYDRLYWQTRGSAKRKARQAPQKSERKRGK